MPAETIAKKLGRRKAGSTWMARCPAHEDREPSLLIADADDGKVLVRCHAGCEQQWVISALRARGIWSDASRYHGKIIGSQSGGANELDRSDAKRTQGALRIWGTTVPNASSTIAIWLTNLKEQQ